MCSVDHVGFEQLEIGDISVVTLKFAHLLDVLVFKQNKGVVGVAVTVDERKNGVAVFPTVFAGKPTWRFGERYHAEEENDGGNHLQPPRDTECCWTVDEGTAVGDARSMSICVSSAMEDGPY